MSRVKQITRNRNGCDVKEIFSLQMIYTREGITTDDDPPCLPSPSLAEDINPVWSVCVWKAEAGKDQTKNLDYLNSFFGYLNSKTPLPFRSPRRDQKVTFIR